MPRNFNLRGPLRGSAARMKDARMIMRTVLGILLLANLAAALIAFHPWGGSAADLERQQDQLRKQLLQQQARLESTKTLAGKVENARKEGDVFLAKYITDRRMAFSLIVSELNQAAADAGLKPKEAANVLEPIEDSETLSQLTITAGFEGNYASLTKFMNLLDKSPRFLIIESLQASPQQNSQMLNVSVKLDTFVREEPGGVS